MICNRPAVFAVPLALMLALVASGALVGCVVPASSSVLRWYPELKELESTKFTDREGRFAAPKGIEVAVSGVVNGRAGHAGRLLVILSRGGEAPGSLIDSVVAIESEAALANFYTYVTGRPLPTEADDDDDENDDGSTFIDSAFGRCR